MKKEMIIAALVAGLLAGGVSANLLTSDVKKAAGYCETLEINIEQNKSFKGTVDCFNPGEVDTEIPEEVNKSAELKCVCRKSYNGSVTWMNIAVSN